MDIVLYSLTSSLGRRLEQRSHIHVEATVSITCSHHFCTTVVTILPHLSDEDTRTTTLSLGKLIGHLLGLLEVCIIL